MVFEETEHNWLTSKKVALFDVDRTLTEKAITLDFINAQTDAAIIQSSDGLKRAIDNMNSVLVSGKYEDRLSQLLVEHALALEDTPCKEVEAHAAEFYGQENLWLPYVKPTFRAFKKYEYKTFLVSAGPDFSVSAIARTLGANGSFNSTYGVKSSVSGEKVYDGNVISDLATIGRKAKAALKIIELYSRRGSFMLADSVADVGALVEVDNPFCVNPSKDLSSVAHELKWPLIPLEVLRHERVPSIILGRLVAEATAANKPAWTSG